MEGRARLESFGLEEGGVSEGSAGETVKIDLSERPERSEEEVVLGCALSRAKKYFSGAPLGASLINFSGAKAAFSRALHCLDFFVPFVSRQKGHHAKGVGRGVGLVREGRPDTLRRLQNPRSRLRAAGLQRGGAAADGRMASGARVRHHASGPRSGVSGEG